MKNLSRRFIIISLSMLVLFSLCGGVALAVAEENSKEQSQVQSTEETQQDETQEINERDAKKKAETDEEQARSPKYKADSNINIDAVEESSASESSTEKVAVTQNVTASGTEHTIVMDEGWNFYVARINADYTYGLLGFSSFGEVKKLQSGSWSAGDTIVISDGDGNSIGSGDILRSDGGICVADGVKGVTLKLEDTILHTEDDDVGIYTRHIETYYAEMQHIVNIGNDCDVDIECQGENYLLGGAYRNDTLSIGIGSKVNLKVEEGSFLRVGAYYEIDKTFGSRYQSNTAISMKTGASLNISGGGSLYLDGNYNGIYGRADNKVNIQDIMMCENGMDDAGGLEGETGAVILNGADSSFNTGVGAKIELFGDEMVTAAEINIKGGSITGEQLCATKDINMSSGEVGLEGNDSMYAGGNINISGGKLTLKSTENNTSGMKAGGNIGISSAISVDIQGEHTGVTAGGSIYINSNDVNIKGNDEYAMTANGSITVDGGNITATLLHGDDSYYTAAVRSFNGDINLNGGTLTANAGNYDNDVAIMAAGTIAMNGATVNADGHLAALQANKLHVGVGTLSVKQSEGKDPDNDYDDYERKIITTNEIEMSGGNIKVVKAEAGELKADTATFFVGLESSIDGSLWASEVYIKDNAKVELTGSLQGDKLEVTGGDTDIKGNVSFDQIDISGRNTKFTAGDAIYAITGINIKEAHVKASVNSKDYGLYVSQGGLDIVSGTVEAEAQNAVFVSDNLTISGGKLIANSTVGMHVGGIFSITGGEVEAYGGVAAIQARSYDLTNIEKSHVAYQGQKNDFNLSENVGIHKIFETDVTMGMQGQSLPYLRIQPMQGDYLVHFNKNSDSVQGRMEDQYFTESREQALSTNAFSNSQVEKYFYGWNTAYDESGDSYKDMQVVSDLVPDDKGVVNLYAVWDDCQTLDLNNAFADKDKKLTINQADNESQIIAVVTAVDDKDQEISETIDSIDNSKPILIKSDVKQIVVDENVTVVSLRLNACSLRGSEDTAGLDVGINSTVNLDMVSSTTNEIDSVKAQAGSTLNFSGAGTTNVSGTLLTTGKLNIYGGQLLSKAIGTEGLNVYGGVVKVTGAGNDAIAIKATGDILVTGANTVVEVSTSSTTENGSKAIVAGGTITIEDGRVIANSDKNNALEAASVNFEGGNIEANGGNSAVCSAAVNITGDYTNVKLDATKTGILSDGGTVTISDASVNISTGLEGTDDCRAVKAKSIKITGAKLNANSKTALLATEDITIKESVDENEAVKKRSEVTAIGTISGIKVYDETKSDGALNIENSVVNARADKTSAINAIYSSGTISINNSEINAESESGVGIKTTNGAITVEGKETKINSVGALAGIVSEAGEIKIDGAKSIIAEATQALLAGGNIYIGQNEVIDMLKLTGETNGISSNGLVLLKVKTMDIYGKESALVSKEGAKIEKCLDISGTRYKFYEGEDEATAVPVESISLNAGKTSKYIAVKSIEWKGLFIDDGSIEISSDLQGIKAHQDNSSIEIAEEGTQIVLSIAQHNPNVPTNNKIKIESPQSAIPNITLLLEGIYMENEDTAIEIGAGAQVTIETLYDTTNIIKSKEFGIKHLTSASGLDDYATIITGKGTLDISSENVAIRDSNKLIINGGTVNLNGITAVQAYDMEVSGENTSVNISAEKYGVNAMSSINIKGGSFEARANTGQAVLAQKGLTLPSSGYAINNSEINYLSVKPLQ